MCLSLEFEITNKKEKKRKKERKGCPHLCRKRGSCYSSNVKYMMPKEHTFLVISLLLFTDNKD